MTKMPKIPRNNAYFYAASAVPADARYKVRLPGLRGFTLCARDLGRLRVPEGTPAVPTYTNRRCPTLVAVREQFRHA